MCANKLSPSWTQSLYVLLWSMQEPYLVSYWEVLNVDLCYQHCWGFSILLYFQVEVEKLAIPKCLFLTCVLTYVYV